MKRGALLQVVLELRPESEDAGMELLGAVLAQPVSVHIDVETGRIEASVYLEDPAAWTPAARGALKAGLERMRGAGLNVEGARIRARSLPRENWAESWKRHFKPFLLGGTLLIKPSWSRRKASHGQAAVVLDPGLSFGTGQHPTTRFCLEQLVAARRHAGATSLLDAGTGSGILAIAAAKLGYQPVDAFDFDPDCVRVAGANARRNRVLDRIGLVQMDLTRMPRRGRRQYDVVCANLIHDLLVAERDRLLARLRPGGRLVLAGILRTQFPAVAAAFRAAGLVCLERRAEGEWESGAFGKR